MLRVHQHTDARGVRCQGHEQEELHEVTPEAAGKPIVASIKSLYYLYCITGPHLIHLSLLA